MKALNTLFYWVGVVAVIVAVQNVGAVPELYDDFKVRAGIGYDTELGAEIAREQQAFIDDNKSYIANAVLDIEGNYRSQISDSCWNYAKDCTDSEVDLFIAAMVDHLRPIVIPQESNDMWSLDSYTYNSEYNAIVFEYAYSDDWQVDYSAKSEITAAMTDNLCNSPDSSELISLGIDYAYIISDVYGGEISFLIGEEECS